jgi:Putative zinc-finger
MAKEGVHPSDQEMLLARDDELSSRHAARVRAHLTACSGCRGRMAEIEQTSAAFAQAYRQTVDLRLPSASGPRALLRARLAELASKQESTSWRRLLSLPVASQPAPVVGAAVLLVAMAGSLLIHRYTHPALDSAATRQERDELPDRKLTPGVTRTVSTMSDVCSMPQEEVVAEVSMSMRQEVFRRYGIVNPQASDYEIDYLIAPGLGGVEAIPNLWPERHTSRTWNSRVKDDLEERLHEMVCDGQLDLSTAQHDIASDWIAAYKKYFHTDRPLAPHLRFGAKNRFGIVAARLPPRPAA